MTTSDTIKEMLNDTFGVADWKRRSKTKINNLFELREFEEPKSGVVVSAYTNVETQHTLLYNGSKIIFGVSQDEDELVVVFAEPFAFRKEEIDPKLSDIYPYIGKTPPSYLIQGGNPMYWFCDVGLHSRDQLVADLVSGGFTFDLTLANHLNEDFGGPVYGLPTVASILANRPSIDDGLVEDEDEDDSIYADWKSGETIYFGVHDSSDGIAASFAPKAQWERDGYLFDQHVGDVLKSLGFVFPSYIGGEDMENCFGVWEPGQGLMQRPPTVTKQQVINDLTAAGFVFKQELDDLLNQ